MRKAAVGAAAVLLVLALIVLLVPRVVSLDSLKPRIVAMLEEKTGRKIALSGLSLSLFPGIGVKIAGLEVADDERHPGESLIRVPEGEVRLAIGPLFSGRAEFTTLILRRPEIHLHRYEDGTHSLTEIANRLAQQEEAEEAPSFALGRKKGKVQVLLESVNVEDGALSFWIEGKGGREIRWALSPVTFRLSGIGGERNDFRMKARLSGAVRGEVAFAGKSVHEKGSVVNPTVFDLRGEGEVFGQKVTVEGKMSAPAGPTEVDLAIVFPRIGVDRIAGIFADPPPALAAARLEGVGSLTAKVSGSLQSMGVEVEADLTRVGWTVRDDPEIRKYIDSPCTLIAQGRYFPGRVFLSNAELRSPPLLLIANAAMDLDTGLREWAISSRIASLAEFGKTRTGVLAAWSPAGKVTASGRGKRDRFGERDAFEIAVDLGNVGVKVPGRRVEFRSMSGHLEVTPEAVRFRPLAGLLNGQRFLLRGDAVLGPKPRGHVDVRMSYLDLDVLFPPDEEGKARVQTAKETTAVKKRPSVSVRASLAIDAGKASGLTFRDLKGEMRYQEGILFVDSASAGMYGGEVGMSGRIGLGSLSPDFQVKIDARDVAAEEILSRKTSLGDLLSGSASLSVQLEGGMKDFDDFARSAKGAGSVRISRGRIKGVDLLATAAGLAGLEAFAPARSPIPGTAAAGETGFSDLSADFRVENGKIRTESLRILSEKLGWDGKASIGFDRTIDLQGVLRLSREMSRGVRGGAGKFLIGEDGRVEIPLVMTGPLSSPAAAIDPGGLVRGGAERLLRGLREGIPESRPASGADDPAAAKEPAAREPLKEVEGLLRKVLPGK